jgi:hypothetical protein
MLICVIQRYTQINIVFLGCVKLMKKYFLILFILLVSPGLYAQDDDAKPKTEEEKLIQFSGVIRNLKYEAVPNVHIINIHKRTGTTSNRKGMFSFIVNPSDSILFTAVGYKNTLVVIPEKNKKDKHYPRDVYMLNDTIKIAEVKVFPWKSYEEFKVAFINLELPDSDTERAIKNIALIKAQLNMDFEPDANLAFDYTMQQQNNKLYYAGQYPPISVLNPLKWAEFFQALKNDPAPRTQHQ